MKAAPLALVLASVFPSIALAAGLADAPPGATACSGCHPAGRVDTPVPSLAGRNSADIAAAMAAFKSGQTPATVMRLIAKGFSDDEIEAIAAWYGGQKN